MSVQTVVGSDLEVSLAEAAPLVPTQTSSVMSHETPANTYAPRQVVLPPVESTPAKSIERSVFNSSPFIDQLVAALAEASLTFKPIERTKEARVKSRRTDAEYSYEYETLADVIEATRESLSRAGLVVMQFPFTGQSTLTLRTMLAHKSGQWMSNDVVIALPEGLAPQSVGIVITYAMRYTRKAILGLSASWDDTDGVVANREDEADYRESTRRSEQARVKPVLRPEDTQTPATSPEQHERVIVFSGQVVEWIGKVLHHGEVKVGASVGIRVLLSHGRAAGTIDPELTKSLQTLIAMGATMKLTVRGAREQSKLPTIIGVEVVPHTAAS